MRGAATVSRTFATALAALTVCIATWSTPARAFHAGNVFDKPAGAGGGGGIFYVGAASEHGWTCAACHVDAPGKIKVTLAADPPSLLQTFRYEPGKTYAIKATLDGEHLGAGGANFNSLAVAFVDARGGPAGDVSGYAADEFYAGRTTIVSAGQRVGATSWSFKWTAPRAPGAVKLHVAAVDGNGANGAGGGTLTDPFGDDVFVGAVTLTSGATAWLDTKSQASAPLAMLGVLCAFGWNRRRGGRR